METRCRGIGRRWRPVSRAHRQGQLRSACGARSSIVASAVVVSVLMLESVLTELSVDAVLDVSAGAVEVEVSAGAELVAALLLLYCESVAAGALCDGVLLSVLCA